MPPGSAKAFGIDDDSTADCMDRSSPAGPRNALTSFVKACCPASLLQTFPLNRSFTCFSATSPSRRSNGSGTSGARRSAASGTPNRTTAMIDAVAASDQPTIFATPRRPG